MMRMMRMRMMVVVVVVNIHQLINAYLDYRLNASVTWIAPQNMSFVHSSLSQSTNQSPSFGLLYT